MSWEAVIEGGGQHSLLGPSSTTSAASRRPYPCPPNFIATLSRVPPVPERRPPHLRQGSFKYRSQALRNRHRSDRGGVLNEDRSLHQERGGKGA